MFLVDALCFLRNLVLIFAQTINLTRKLYQNSRSISEKDTVHMILEIHEYLYNASKNKKIYI